MILTLGALLGFISVAFGAFTEHGLKGTVSEEQLRFLMTAIRYNQVNAVMISAIGLIILSPSYCTWKLLKISGWLFIIGTVLFSISIYVSVVANLPQLVNITPIGGITIMLSWLLLAVASLSAAKQTKRHE